MKLSQSHLLHPAAIATSIFLLCIAMGSAWGNAAEHPCIIQIPSGIRFGILQAETSSPAPTLFVFASSIEDSLMSQGYNKIGTIVRRHGYHCVSLDLPYHPGDELVGWAGATKQGKHWTRDFVSHVSRVLDYLIKEGYTDPQRVAVAGTSRGGFVAMQLAAADPRIKCAIGFVPVTDLTELTEFTGLRESPFAKSLSLANVAEDLSGRSIWVGIGNNDDRVNTDKAIEFTRKVVAAANGKKKSTDAEFIDVELHVMPWPGHGADQPWSRGCNAHDAAADWLLSRMAGSVDEHGREQ